jgi:hypothetical protein
MAIRVACPACRQKLRLPDGLAGSQMACPRCGAAILVPLSDRAPKESLARAAAACAHSPGDGVATGLEHAPLGARLGVVALVLGLVAGAVLCVPVLGYASLVPSGLGLLLGLWGLFRPTGGSSAGKSDGRARSYPLAGTLVCLLALLLALLPFLFRLW